MKSIRLLPPLLALPLTASAAGSHSRAYMLVLVYFAVAGVGGAWLGRIVAERLFRRRAEPPTFSLNLIVSALIVAVCALAIFAALSLATMAVMQFMF